MAIDYPLAPEHPAPEQQDAALLACRAILLEIQGRNFRAKLVLAGDSAGGYLASRCALFLNSEAAGTVDRLILFYPLIDPDPNTNAMQGLGGVATRWMQSLTGLAHYRSLLDEPLYLLPPTLVVTGRRLDQTYRNTKRFAETLRTLEVPVKFLEIPWLPHGALNFAHRSDVIRRVFDQITVAVRSLLLPT